MSVEELRNIGVRLKMFNREKDGSCIISNDFNKFYEKHRIPSKGQLKLFKDWMKEHPMAGNKEVSDDGKEVSVNITRLTFEFVIDNWIHKNNIVLIDEEFKLATDALLAVCE